MLPHYLSSECVIPKRPPDHAKPLATRILPLLLLLIHRCPFLQSQRVLPSLLVPTDPRPAWFLAVRLVVVLARVLVLVLNGLAKTLRRFARGPADTACETADCGSETFVQDLADWVAYG